MFGSTVSHDRILNKLGDDRGKRYLSCPWCGNLRPASAKTLPDVFDCDTEQIGYINRHSEFRQLKQEERG
jgi:hypothetical protein